MLEGSHIKLRLFLIEFNNALLFPVAELMFLILVFGSIRLINLPQSPFSFWSTNTSFSETFFVNVMIPIVSGFNIYLIPYAIFMATFLGQGINNGTVGAHFLFGISRFRFLIYNGISHFIILSGISIGALMVSSAVLWVIPTGSGLALTLFVITCWNIYIVSSGLFSGVVTGNPVGGAFLSVGFVLLPEFSAVLGLNNPSTPLEYFVAGLSRGAASITYINPTGSKESSMAILGLITLIAVSVSLVIISFLFLNSRDIRAGR